VEEPLMRLVPGEDDHFIACHFPLGAPEAPPKEDLLAAQHAADATRAEP
jgi:hypothetical protein